MYTGERSGHLLFNSIEFAVFLPVVFAVYWMLPRRFQWHVLLISSYIFYMSWKIEYVILILVTTVVSFYSALLIERCDQKRKKVLLAVTLSVCLGILFFFKYFNFFTDTVRGLLGVFRVKTDPVMLNLILPVGISFYTFQTLSYVIDVYKGVAKAEHNIGKYAAFISFFPQLVAGPIERTNNLLPQIRAEHEFDYRKAVYGLKIMAWGFFKKIAVADVLGIFTREVFDAPRNYQGFSLLLAVIMFTFQIYCDFSGYSDIAFGAAKLFGIDLMYNFKSPYFSQSIREFWSRWHISLSTWFRDYVYIPLGGNRRGGFRRAVNTMITFLASGLWHGANGTFVIWGGIHGVGQVVENALVPKDRTYRSAVRWLKTALVFCFCALAWTFFAAKSIPDAFYIIRHMFDGITGFLEYPANSLNIEKDYIFSLTISFAILILYDYFSLKHDVISLISSRKKVVRWCVYVLFVLWIIFNVAPNDKPVFIYFQF